MRIRFQLALVLSAVAALGFAVSAALAVAAIRRIAHDLVAQHQARETEALGRVAGAALAAKAEPVLAEAMRAMSVYPGVRYAYLVGKDGKILMHPEREFLGRPASDWLLSGRAKGASELVSPVRVGSDPLGATVRVGYDPGLLAGLSAAVPAAVALPFTVLAALGVAASIAAGLFLAFFLTRPVERLAEAARVVGQGDLSVQVEEESSDELGGLSVRFNAMVRGLREVEELKDELIAAVSHDLRSPMAAIRMYTDFMLRADKERDRILPRHREMLGVIMTNASRLEVFVSNILDAAKLKAGRMEYHVQPVEVPALAGRLLELYAPMAAEKKVALDMDAPAGLPPVLADPAVLESAASNLLSNALKFTPAGGRITVGAREAEGGVELWVQDSGKGIPPEDLPRLFQRFAQAQVAEQRGAGVQGTGLGLYIVKTHVEAMGGSVAVESEPGKGTRVSLRLRSAPAVSGASAPSA